MTHRCPPICVTCWVQSIRTRLIALEEQSSTLLGPYGSLIISIEESGTVSKHHRPYIKRETVMVPNHDSKLRELNRWVVRLSDDALVGYSSTWFGAWRMACEVVGWKVPR